ncbi:alpha/beta fold hydrolase [Brevibacillus ginsengisoli]|uniref:alpha/beta fold hydrolase n=1 Tax=Brevibacillus ginsengisoli TaxID=363854 RepID=UPI003CF95D3D
MIKTSKGTIHYEIHGEGHPIVILHPLAMDYRAMKYWMEPIFENPKLALNQYQRIYVDLPAHGHSQLTAEVKTSDDLLVSLLEFIQMLLPNRSFSLAGMSFGGYMAQGVMSKMSHQVMQSVATKTTSLFLRNSLAQRTRFSTKRGTCFRLISVNWFNKWFWNGSIEAIVG